MGDPRVLEVPSVKINYCHVFCDWQMVSNSTNQDWASVNKTITPTINVSDQSTQITQQKPYKVESIFGNDIKISWNTKLEMLGNFSLKMLRPIIGCRGLSFSHHLSVCVLNISVKIWPNSHRILRENLRVFLWCDKFENTWCQSPRRHRDLGWFIAYVLK